MKTRITKCIKLWAFDQTGQTVPIPCGQWKCPDCAKMLARKWAGRAKLHIQRSTGQEAWFWTITMRGKYRDAKTAYRDLPKLWDTLRKIIQRYVDNWQYLAFVEAHPKRNGIPHFHIISMSKAPYRIKDLTMRAGFGYMSKEKKITGPQAASYCAKYASKTGPDVPKNFRRVRSSRDWAKYDDAEGDTLLVKAAKETTFDFIWRVHGITGVDIDTLRDRWLDATSSDDV